MLIYHNIFTALKTFDKLEVHSRYRNPYIRVINVGQNTFRDW